MCSLAGTIFGKAVNAGQLPLPASPAKAPEIPVVPQAVPSVPKPTVDLSRWGLVPELEQKAQAFLSRCADAGYSLKLTQGLRTMAQQQALYDQGRTAPGKVVTNAKPGQSQHNFGKAFDVAFTGSVPYPSENAKWKAIADIGTACGLVPGYYFRSFQDKPHFEIR